MGNKKGFTLIELLSTIFVLGIVLAIATTSTIGIYKAIKQKALEEKIAIIEESAILFGENRKENIVKSTSVYNDSPCKSFKLRELVPKYIENDTDSECINSDNQNEVGCIIDPSDKDNYLDETEVIVFYKNKRIYSVVDIDDELVCENTELTPEVKEFYLEDGKTTTVNKTNVSAYLSWDTENIKYYCLTEDASVEKCVWNSVNNKLVLTDYTLSSTDGKKKVYAFIKDKYENLSESKSYEITLDTSAPTNNSVKINDSEYTNSTNVTLYLSSNGAKEMCVSNTTNCSSWEDYATSKTYTLTSGEGEKTVYIWFRDEYGNTSEYVTDTITLDTSAPANNSVKINDSEYTNSTNVTLYLSSNGAKEMCVSNTNSCTNWEEFKESKIHSLTTGDGTKTVYVWFRDTAGNTTSSYVTDTIIYDSNPPTLTVTTPTGTSSSSPTYTTSSSYTVKGSASDSSGIKSVTVNGTTITVASDGTWSRSLSLTANTTTTVTVIATDKAGRTKTVTRYVRYDTASPTVTASAVSNNTNSPKISITSNETGTYCVNTSSTKTNFSNCTLTGSVSANIALTTSALSSSGTYYVHVKDGAGNIGISSAISITKVYTIGEYVLNSKPKGLNSSMEDGLYRFEGAQGTVNNYICFGTSTKSTCTGNTDRYMYRIIGINSSKQVKLIKKETLNSAIAYFYGSTSDNVTWPNSNVYSLINGSEFLTNTTYVPSGWSSKIQTYNWKYGDFSGSNSFNKYADSIYDVENAWTSTISAKIGLLYVHDYYYSPVSTGYGTNCGSYSNSSTCLASWMHVSNNDTSLPSINKYEWIMSRWNTSGTNYSLLNILPDGSLGGTSANTENSVRPVFYLTSSVNYVSGTGTSTDPFIIS